MGLGCEESATPGGIWGTGCQGVRKEAVGSGYVLGEGDLIVVRAGLEGTIGDGLLVGSDEGWKG